MDPLSIAGLALGAYPVFFHAFIQYKDGIEHFQNWRRFRRQFEEFGREVEAQSYFFENVMRELVFGGPSPFPLKGITADAVFDCMRDNTDSIWQNSVLQRTIKIRLGDRYDWFMATIQQIHETLQEFYILLRIPDLETSERSAQWWEFQWRRIKETLLIERRDKKLEKLRGLIENLQRTLELRDKRLNVVISNERSPFSQLVKTVRENAHSLYATLKSGWRCPCTSPHTTLLQLENQQIRNLETRFDVLFIMPSKQSCESNSADGENPGESVQIRQGVEVEISDQKSATVQQSSHIDTPSMIVPNQEIISTVRLKEKAEQKSGFKKLYLGIRSKTRSSLRSQDSLLQTSSNKSTTSQETPSHTRSSSPSSLDVSTLFSITKADLSSSNGTTLQNTLLQQNETVIESKGILEESSSNSGLIADLCSIIQAPLVVNWCFGYLVDEKHRRHQFFAKDRSEIIRSKHLVSLNEVLQWNDRTCFSKQQRMMVATILMTSLMGLSQTRWLSSNWSKHDIHFIRTDGGSKVLFHRPYVLRDFQSNVKDVTREPSEFHGMKQDTLLKIFLECLGIILIELCFGMTIEQIQNTALVTPVDASNSESYHAYCFSIANRIEWDVVNGEDPVFSDPVSNCLHPPNMRMVREGKHDEIVDDIFLTIIKPLQDEMQTKWPGALKQTRGRLET